MRDYSVDRELMLNVQIAARGVTDPMVLAAMRRVPREAFVPAHLADVAYADEALPIGAGQTISQPYIVARMAAAARIGPGDRVLEIGTGSGYDAAVLSHLAREVYSVERIDSLARAAEQLLARLGYTNVHVRSGDGTLGWPEHAPFDVIIVTAGGPDVPPALLEQLALGGRLVMPVGASRLSQQLVRVVKTARDRSERHELEPVAFVPLVGEQGWDGKASS